MPRSPETKREIGTGDEKDDGDRNSIEIEKTNTLSRVSPSLRPLD
jgi:hypothetical protein